MKIERYTHGYINIQKIMLVNDSSLRDARLERAEALYHLFEQWKRQPEMFSKNKK
jgi:hypothetical protein